MYAIYFAVGGACCSFDALINPFADCSSLLGNICVKHSRNDAKIINAPGCLLES